MFCSLDILQVLNFESSSSVLHEGKSVRFKLELRSKTMYEVQWFHTGYLIANPSRRYKETSLETENNTSLHTFHIANVLQRDMGNKKYISARLNVFCSSYAKVHTVDGLFYSNNCRNMENHGVKSCDIFIKEFDS